MASFAQPDIHITKPLQPAPWLSFGLTSAEEWAYCWLACFSSTQHLALPRHATAIFSPLIPLSSTYALSSPAISHFFKLTSACFSSFPFMDPCEVGPRPERSAGYRLKSTALNQYVSCGSCLPLPNYFIIMLLFILKFSFFLLLA